MIVTYYFHSIAILFMQCFICSLLYQYIIQCTKDLLFSNDPFFCLLFPSRLLPYSKFQARRCPQIGDLINHNYRFYLLLISDSCGVYTVLYFNTFYRRRQLRISFQSLYLWYIIPVEATHRRHQREYHTNILYIIYMIRVHYQ